MKAMPALLFLLLPFFVSAQPIHEERFLNMDQTQRRYLLHAPTSFPGQSLVVLMHSANGTPENTQIKARIDTLANREGFVVAYPAALGAASLWMPSDSTFIEAMVDSLIAEFALDPTRVYLGGFSRGAVFTHFLGNRLNDRFAALSPLCSCMFAGIPSLDPPPRGMGVLLFQNFYDETATWEDGLFVKHVWIDWNECDADSSREVYSADPLVWWDRHAGGRDDSEVEMVTFHLEGGPQNGHVWPHLASAGVEPAWEMWRFFQEYTTAGHVDLLLDLTPTVRLVPSAGGVLRYNLRLHNWGDVPAAAVYELTVKGPAGNESAVLFEHEFVLEPGMEEQRTGLPLVLPGAVPAGVYQVVARIRVGDDVLARDAFPFVKQ